MNLLTRSSKNLIDILLFWKPQNISFPQLKDWYASLHQKPYRTLKEAEKTLVFNYEQLSLPPILESSDLIMFNGARLPGGTALHIEQIIFCGTKKAFRMLGMYLIAAALRIKYDETVQLHCSNKEISPCKGLIISTPRQSELEKQLELAPAVLLKWSWTPSIPKGDLTHWTRELDNEKFPKDHLPWLRLGSEESTYDEQHRPRSDEPMFIHLEGTLASLCWLGRGLLNFSLEDHPCHSWSLLNYGGHNSLASGSAELRCVTPGGAEIPATVARWLAKQSSHTIAESISTPLLTPQHPHLPAGITLRKRAEPAPSSDPTPTQEVE